MPLSDPPEDKSSPPVAVKPPPLLPSQKPIGAESTSKPVPINQPQQSEMIIKAKPLNIKKQSLGEQPKLRSLNSHSKLNGLILNNRRIELPPVYQFSESQVRNIFFKTVCYAYVVTLFFKIYQKSKTINFPDESPFHFRKSGQLSLTGEFFNCFLSTPYPKAKCLQISYRHPL